MTHDRLTGPATKPTLPRVVKVGPFPSSFILKSVGKKLLWSLAIPALAISLLGVAVLWQRADHAVREATREQAVGQADFLATTFSLASEQAGSPRDAHKAVTWAVRTNPTALKHAAALRVIDRDGVVRWSRRIEEEDRPLPDAPRLLAVGPGTVNFEAPKWPLPFLGDQANRGEVVYPLGGVACAGCHVGQSTMRVGVLQLTVDEPSLRREVALVFLRGLGGLWLFWVLLAVGVSLALRVFLTRPLARLTQAMQRAEEGDFLARSPVTGDDEIGRLSASFNRMVARITSLRASEIDQQRDLDQARVELELKGELEKTNQQLSGRLQELGILYDVSRALNATLNLKEVLEGITALVPARLSVPKFSIMLLSPNGELEVVAAQPANAGSEGLIFAVGEGICGKAALTRKSVYVPDLETDTIFKVRGGDNTKGRGCLLSVPMVHRGALLGVLNFERPEKAGISAEEIELCTAVADQAAMAVQNARLHQQTVELSITDPLTGVPNRRHLFAQLDAEINRANRFGTQLSILMIDIDHFKRLNDGAGHAAGDDVLREVCDLMRRNVRRVDTLARYGGEEFVVVLPQVTRNEALEVAEKLRRAVEEAPVPHRDVQPSGKVTISVGVSNLPVDATDQARLVDCADAALYASKRGGRNRCTAFAQGMEMHPGRERGPHAQRRRTTGEMPAVTPATREG
ncbi:MAG: diguanylate cyclase [Archangiaceae bacterium]|nr:diguanylate cyclase [Archangiaceae bacterium]